MKRPHHVGTPDPLGIEPLDEERWARIEEGIFARLDGEAVATPRVSRLPARAFVARRAVGGAATFALAAGLLLYLGAAHRGTPAPIASDPSAVAPRPPAVVVTAAAAASEAEPAPAPSSPPVPHRAPPHVAPSTPRAPIAEPAPVVEPPPSPGEPVPEPAPTPAPLASARRDAFDRAARLEATAPADALAGYHALASGGDAWAANALFAEGRLALERGERSRGERCLEDYLARFPAGPNAGDARELLARGRRR